MEKRELDKFIVEAIKSSEESTGRRRVRYPWLLKELQQMNIKRYG